MARRIVRRLVPLLLLIGATAGSAEDARSTAIVDWRCSSELGDRLVTVFANGTVRLKERIGDRSRLRLAELEAGRVATLRDRLAGEDLREAKERPGLVRGEWVARCGLDLQLRPGLPDRYTYSELDPLPLGLKRVLDHIEGFLVDLDLRDLSALPVDYQPRVGDLLRDYSGILFEVIAYTSDNRGVELQAQDQPITEYLAVEAVAERFVELVSRRDRR